MSMGFDWVMTSGRDSMLSAFRKEKRRRHIHTEENWTPRRLKRAIWMGIKRNFEQKAVLSIVPHFIPLISLGYLVGCKSPCPQAHSEIELSNLSEPKSTESILFYGNCMESSILSNNLVSFLHCCFSWLGCQTTLCTPETTPDKSN